MSTTTVLEREEYIEQAYFFYNLRERLGTELATQEILQQIDQEILSTTRLPYAIQFLAAELRHSGLLSTGFARLRHYFTPFQGFIIKGTEEEGKRFNIFTGLLVLEREAEYRATGPSPQGLFIYQFEVICRNRLGYDEGLQCMACDPIYDDDWRAFLETVRRQVGIVDFADIIYLRSQLYVQEQRRRDSSYTPSLPALFGEKEGKIARANRGRDPLYLFAALQRQLNYPEVPRSVVRDDSMIRLESIETKLHELETRLKLMEAEMRGQVDLSQFGKPELFKNLPDEG